MNYIIIDNFNGNITILTKDGEPAVFESAKEAQKYSDGEAQNGIVVPLTNILTLLDKISGFINAVRFIEGEEVDEDNIEEEVNRILGDL